MTSPSVRRASSPSPAPPNFESPQGSGLDNNQYLINIQARDDNFNRSSLDVTVTVNDVNEGPEVTGSVSLTFTENQATDRVLAAYTGRDPEDPSAAITRWSLAGTDGSDFTINENGELSFRNVPDHERPADSNRDNVYNFSVRASDGSLYGYLSVIVTVEGVNEAAHHYHHQQDGLHLSGERHRHHLYLQGHRP